MLKTKQRRAKERSDFFESKERASRRKRDFTKNFNPSDAPGLGIKSLWQWRKARAQALFSALEPGPSAPIGADLLKPWWAVYRVPGPQNGRPNKARKSALALMGLAALGAPAPDWSEIFKAAALFFELRSRELGNNRAISIGYLKVGERLEPSLSPPSEGLWRAGRRADVAWSYSSNASAVSERAEMALLARFDKRRARRRARMGSKRPSLAWRSEFSSESANLWRAGLSAALPIPAPCDYVFEGLSALAQAMKSAGALSVALNPSLFEDSPQALDNRESMERADALTLDPLRSRWILEAQASSAKRGASQGRDHKSKGARL